MITVQKSEDIAELIEREISKLEFPEQPSSLYDPVRYMLSLNGKRVRFYFTLLGCGLCSGNIKEAIPAATAVELLHNFTLLHDDIMDAAATRRGKDSVFKKWDASRAILSGDAMYAWAFEQLQYYGREEEFSKSQYYAIMDIFLQSAKTVCEGQAYDLDFEENQSVSLHDYINMIDKKTAALISGSLELGGVIAGNIPTYIKRLETIGKHVGAGFQIQDDLLDVVADPAKFGKKLGGDIYKGKKTYLFLLSMERAAPNQQQKLKTIIEHKKNSEQQVKDIIAIYEQLDVITTAQEVIKYHYDEALKQIGKFGQSRYKVDLTKFLINLKNREY